MKVTSKTSNSVTTFNKLRLVALLPSLCNVECVFFSLAAEFKVHVTWSTANLFASVTNCYHLERGTRLVCFLHLLSVFSIHDAGYNQFVFIHYGLKSHLKRRMHPLGLYLLPNLSSFTKYNAIDLFPSVT